METESQARRMIRASFNPRTVTVNGEDFYRPWKGTLEEYVSAVVCASRVHAASELPPESSIAAVYVCVANYPVEGAISAPCYAWVGRMLDVPFQSRVWWWVEYEMEHGRITNNGAPPLSAEEIGWIRNAFHAGAAASRRERQSSESVFREEIALFDRLVAERDALRALTRQFEEDPKA